MKLEELKEEYPIIAIESPTRAVSDSYVHIPSYDVVKILIQWGWEPINVEFRGFGDSETCKHAVFLEKPVNFYFGSEITKPRLVFVNSYDGLGTLKFYSEMYREKTNMSLTVPIFTEDRVLTHLKLSHSTYTVESMTALLKQHSDSIALAARNATNLYDCQLTDVQIIRFVESAFKLRGINKEVADRILDTVDSGNAWLLLYNVQEKLIKGFQDASKKYRGITSFEKRININLDLYLIMKRVIG